MKQRPKLYLAGPEVFLPEASAIGRNKKELCTKYGFEGLFPFDTEISPGSGAPIDRLIYCANIRMIRAADGGIFNLTPFRGQSADVGTVFELGLFTGLEKPTYAYSNADGTLLDRMKKDGTAKFDEATGTWRDSSGMAIEDFGIADNLMVVDCLAEQGDRLVQQKVKDTERFSDLSGFKACLEQAHAHFYGVASRWIYRGRVV